MPPMPWGMPGCCIPGGAPPGCCMAESAAAVAPGALGLTPASAPPGANGDIPAIIVFCAGLAGV